MSSHLAHYLPFLLLIFFVCPTITVFLMSFTSTMHYVVLLISNKNLPLKKKVQKTKYEDKVQKTKYRR